MTDRIKTLSEEDLNQILYISKQSSGRYRLIKNLWSLNTEELQYILDSQHG